LSRDGAHQLDATRQADMAAVDGESVLPRFDIGHIADFQAHGFHHIGADFHARRKVLVFHVGGDESGELGFAGD